MSPSIAINHPSGNQAPHAQGFAFSGNANSNEKKKTTVSRRKPIRPPMAPRNVRNLTQCIMAADEGWQDLWQATLARCERRDRTDDAALLVAFSRVIHSVIDDKAICGLLLNYFDKKLQNEAEANGSV